MAFATAERVMVTGALALGLLAGCDGTSFKVDDAFSPEQTDAIMRAAAEWERATRGAEHFDMVLGGTDRKFSDDVQILRGVSEKCQDDDGCVRHRPWSGPLGEHAQYIIELAPEIDPAIAYGVALHELGHYLGLADRSDRGLVMTESGPVARCVGLEDLRAYCETRACAPASMAPCPDSSAAR